MALTKVRGAGIDTDGQEIILDADADTTITADTDDQIDFKVGGTDRISVKASGSSSVDLSAGSSMKLTVGTSGGSDTHQFINNGTEILKLSPDNAITAQLTSGATTDTTAGLQIDKEDESSSSSTRMIGFIVGGQGRGFITNGASDSSAPSLSAGSDRRLKKNITAYTGGYDKIKSIPVQTWDEQFTDATGIKGWIADELETVFPEAVQGEANATKTVTNAIISEYGNCLKDSISEEEFNKLQAKGKYANCTWSASKVVPSFQMSSPLKFFPDVVQALQEAMARIETLEARIKKLEDG